MSEKMNALERLGLDVRCRFLWDKRPAWRRFLAKAMWWSESVACAVAGRPGPGERLLASHIETVANLAMEREPTLRMRAVR